MNRQLEISVNHQRQTVAYSYLQPETPSNDLIIFLPGLGCSLEDISFAFDEQVLRYYSLISFQYLGFEKSPVTGKLSILDNGEILRHFLTAFKNYRIHIIAHSLGQLFGQRVALQFPNVYSFISLEGHFTLKDCILSQRVVNYGQEAFLHDGFSFIKQQFSQSKEKGIHHYLSRLESRTSAYTYFKYCFELLQLTQDNDLLGEFVQLSCRKIYLFGSNSNVHEVKGYVSGYGIPCMVVEGGGHFFYQDNPSSFSDILKHLLIETFLEDQILVNGKER